MLCIYSILLYLLKKLQPLSSPAFHFPGMLESKVLSKFLLCLKIHREKKKRDDRLVQAAVQSIFNFDSLIHLYIYLLIDNQLGTIIKLCLLLLIKHFHWCFCGVFVGTALVFSQLHCSAVGRASTMHTQCFPSRVKILPKLTNISRCYFSARSTTVSAVYTTDMTCPLRSQLPTPTPLY